ncbi:hypothetical protein BD779DRAFT_1469137 [Infundibulicybe gibba]|nr:hypothetical protein BD779DRAFT_1469137 [Infundibulicybe gibba]
MGLSEKQAAAHRLFIEERGTAHHDRERMLLPSERPARIVHERSREAGYDDGDFNRFLSGKDTSFMFKFSFKNHLMPSQPDTVLVDFKHVCLTNRDLRSVPKSITDHAREIISLTLGNSIIPAVTPHFLSSCTNLHQLHWSNSAIQRVPRSLGHAFSIRHLDLSSNRIEDLRDMYLDNMPLEVLLLQNNCISEVPSRFSRLASLKTLNLSNNNLETLPDAILSLRISDLDLSFNQIRSIRLEQQSLPGLRRFLVSGNGLRELEYRNIDHLDVRWNQLARLNFSSAKNIDAACGLGDILTIALGSAHETINLSHNHLRLCSCGRVCGCELLSYEGQRYGYQQVVNITSLDISHGMLSRIPLSLSHLQGLRTLRLDHNSLEEFPSKVYHRFPWLEDARLAGNPLPQSPEDLQVRALGSPRAYIGDAQHAQGIFEVVHHFSQGDNISVFAIFQPIPSSGYEPIQSRLLAGHVRDQFVDTLTPYLKHGVSMALRLTFLDMNRQLHARFVRSDDALQAGVGGLVPAWWTRPFDNVERARIRAAGGWISPNGLVNGDAKWNLTESDEFLIMANQQFWECVTYQVAVDIAQSEIDDLGVATQKLLEMALGFGAKDGLYRAVLPPVALIEIGPKEELSPPAGWTPATELEPSHESPELAVGSSLANEAHPSSEIKESPPNPTSLMPTSAIQPPTGHVAIVFADVRSPTPLQATFDASQAYRALLRRELPKCGGYEVVIMVNAFFCIFQNTLAAIRWCLSIQLELAAIRWPVGDSAEPQEEPYVLPISMSVHCGPVISELDPVTHRTDYFGPTVNRAARISALATQGQIICSTDVMQAIYGVVLELGETLPEFFLSLMRL